MEEHHNILGSRVKVSNDRPEGYIDRWSYGGTIYTARRFTDRHDLSQFTNHKIIRIECGRDGYIQKFSTWDGESYKDKFFCTNTCAQKQGYASAAHGDRFTWRPRA